MSDDGYVMQLVDRIMNMGIGGYPPFFVPARELAREYLDDTRYADNDERVASLINWQSSKNGLSGFVTGLGGLFTLPLAIPAALGASWIIQANLAAAVAVIHGHDVGEDRVRTAILMAIVGDAGKEIFKQVGVQVAHKLTTRAMRQIPGRLLIEINKRVGFRLMTKAGERGVVNLMSWVPVVGGIVGGSVDAYSCRCVGYAAHECFRP